MSSTTCDSDVAANSLFDNLVTEADFALPALDLTDPGFQIPDNSGNTLFDPASKLTEADLTSRQPEGSGMFDALMEANKAHLHDEYASGRITSAAYSEAYIAMTTAVMGAAVQYLLQKDNAYYQSLLVQKQAEAAQIGVVQARVELEGTKAELIRQRLAAKTASAQYAHTKLMIASEDAKRCLTQAQSAQVTYETANLLPKQVDTAVAQISKLTADKDQVLYQTASILPAQLAGINADTNTKVYQVENFMPAQTANVTKDTEVKDYTLGFILPAQKDLTLEQYESTLAKTSDTRSDASAVTGSIGKQKQLHQQQIDSYKRDAEWKVAKGLIDTWITGKSMDEAYGTPTNFTSGQIDAVMNAVKANLSL